MKSRYDLMQVSEQKDSSGYNYPDVLTIPLDSLQFSSPLTKVRINQDYKARFYKLCYDQWGITYYDDILLFMNGVSAEDTLAIDEVILVPSKEDMDTYYSTNLVTRTE